MDSALSLRKLQSAGAFLAARWDIGETPWPHVSLLEARQSLVDGHGIFRLSFWQRLEAAERDLATRGFHEPHLMLRVPRSEVHRALVGWTCEEDDFLPGQADLLWATRMVEDHDVSLSNQGVPLSAFEVWEPRRATWQPWYEADRLLPDSTRMPAAGWAPITVQLKDGDVALAYWKVLPSAIPDSSPAFWVLLNLGDTSRGTLRSQDAAIADVARRLVDGPVAAVDLTDLGVLTIYPTRGHVWLQQLALVREPVASAGWLARRLERALGVSSTVLRAHPHGWTASANLWELVRRSGLSYVKTEFAAATWTGA